MTDRPRAVVVVTGSELVRGERRDENGPFLAAELVRLGLDVGRIVIVGDRPEELSEAVHEALSADVCVLSGGLGPTHDDRTVEVLAAAAGRPLRVDPALEREIEAISREFAGRLGRPYADFAAGVRKQASLPEDAISLGLAGTAPGVLLRTRRVRRRRASRPAGRAAEALAGRRPERRVRGGSRADPSATAIGSCASSGRASRPSPGHSTRPEGTGTGSR